MSLNLPPHPTMRHPLTGQPLRALYIDRHGRARYPIMGGDETTDQQAAAAAQKATDEAAAAKKSADEAAAAASPGFPANTPVTEMQPAEQAAYWRDKARKHEGRAKVFDGLTAEDLATLREKAERQDALEDELASDKEKAVKEARTTTQSEADAKYRPLLAETAFRVAIGERKPTSEVDDFIADLNLTRFIKDDGQVDTAKVLSRVEQFAPAKGTTQRKGPTVTGHGSGSGSGSSSGGSVAQVMAERRAARETKQSNSTS